MVASTGLGLEVLEVLPADPVVGEPAVAGRTSAAAERRRPPVGSPHGRYLLGGARQTMIRLSGVGKTYDDGTVAVQELDLDVARGELVVPGRARRAAASRRR